jgi:hypothetical protein
MATVRAEGTTGNPDEVRADELHQRALRIAQPYFQETRSDALSRLRDLTGTGRTVSDLREVFPASHHGRVGVVLL